MWMYCNRNVVVVVVVVVVVNVVALLLLPLLILLEFSDQTSLASTHMPCKGYRKKHPDSCFSALRVIGNVSRQEIRRRRMQPHLASRAVVYVCTKHT